MGSHVRKRDRRIRANRHGSHVDLTQGFPGFQHNPSTFEGTMERFGATFRSAGQRPRVRRLVIVALVALFALVAAVLLVGLLASIA